MQTLLSDGSHGISLGSRSPVRKEIKPELLSKPAEVGWCRNPLLSILVRADFKCEYCGLDFLASFNECFNVQLDHIQPRSNGGSEEESNLAACCTTCNSLKWAYVPRGNNRQERIAEASRRSARLGHGAWPGAGGSGSDPPRGPRAPAGAGGSAPVRRPTGERSRSGGECWTR